MRKTAAVQHARRMEILGVLAGFALLALLAALPLMALLMLAGSPRQHTHRQD